jgi:hypothetical protein
MYPKILFSPFFDQRMVMYFFIKRDDPKRTGRPKAYRTTILSHAFWRGIKLCIGKLKGSEESYVVTVVTENLDIQ